jgi:hypothetical protein
MNKISVVCLISVKTKGNPNLALITEALYTQCLGFRPGHRRQQHRGEDAYDGDNHQEFNQRESAEDVYGRNFIGHRRWRDIAL